MMMVMIVMVMILVIGLLETWVSYALSCIDTVEVVGDPQSLLSYCGKKRKKWLS